MQSPNCKFKPIALLYFDTFHAHVRSSLCTQIIHLYYRSVHPVFLVGRHAPAQVWTSSPVTYPHWHPRIYILPIKECSHAPKASHTCCDQWWFGQRTRILHCDRSHRKRQDGGKLWLIKQALLNTVKNNYGSNLNLINKNIILSWLFLLHIEWIKIQSHSRL